MKRLCQLLVLALIVGGGVFAALAAAKTINGCEIKAFTRCPGADLRGADLHEADLAHAYLLGANLDGAYLRGADLGRARHVERILVRLPGCPERGVRDAPRH
jgi:hypothetical protein